jgi:hypothetical protein
MEAAGFPWKDVSEMGARKWLMIGFHLPARPSRNRVAVWRGLRRLGAVNARNSLWLLPYTKRNRAALEKIADDIETAGGVPVLMSSKILDEGHERRVMALFSER